MNNPETLSDDPVESTRKEGARIQGQILRKLAAVTQARVADCIGVDASTVSRMKASLEDAALLIAALGLQITDSDSMVIPREDLSAYKRFAYMYLKLELEREGAI